MGHTRKKASVRSKSIPLVIGMGTGIGILFAGTALMTNSVSEKGSYGVTGIGIPATCFLAGLLGAIIAGLTESENRFGKALIVGGVLILTLLSVGIFGFGGLKEGIWKNLAAIAVGSLIAGWIRKNRKARPKRGR